MARRATYLDGVLNEGRPILLLDAGGLFGSRTKLDREQTRFVCEITQEFGYDAIALGHADLNYGLAFLREMIASYKLPFISANARDAATGELLLPPYLIVERGGVRFGIVAVLDPNEPVVTMTDKKDEQYQIDDPITVLRDLLPLIRQKAQTVVLLSHLDVQRSEQLLKEVPGVDIAVVGKTHQFFPGERVVNRAIFLAAGYEGRRVGRLDAEIDATGVVQAFTVKVTDLDAKVADDPVVLEKVNRFKARLDDIRLSLRGKHQPVKGDAGEQFLTQTECRKCHADVYAALEQSGHNQAFHTLAKKGMAQEPDCLVCHVTGYEYKGGYDEKPPQNRLVNVQCEACHGYGTQHRRDGKWKAQARASCAACHDEKNSPEFDFATYWAKIKH